MKQLKRIGLTTIYDIRNAGGTLYGFEVIRIKVAPAEEKFGKLYPERELYPSSAKNSDDWGTIAWSYGSTMEKEAFSCFNGLVKRFEGPQKEVRSSDLPPSEGRDS